jgi:fructuronate reductase
VTATPARSPCCAATTSTTTAPSWTATSPTSAGHCPRGRATHLGALPGHRTIADAVADDGLRDIATALIRDDMIPTLAQPDGVDLVEYGDRVLARYTNPGLRHTTVQIAMDGSQKLPQRLVAPAVAAIGAGRRPHAITLGLAAWMAYVARGEARDGRPLPLDDPMADVLGRVRGTTDAATVVDRLLALEPVFGPELPEIGWWRRELVDDVRNLLAGRVPALSVRT